MNIFERNVYQDQNKRRYELIDIEVSKNESYRVIYYFSYKNHFALIKRLNVFKEIIMKILSVDEVLILIQVKVC